MWALLNRFCACSGGGQSADSAHLGFWGVSSWEWVSQWPSHLRYQRKLHWSAPGLRLRLQNGICARSNVSLEKSPGLNIEYLWPFDLLLISMHSSIPILFIFHLHIFGIVPIWFCLPPDLSPKLSSSMSHAFFRSYEDSESFPNYEVGLRWESRGSVPPASADYPSPLLQCILHFMRACPLSYGMCLSAPSVFLSIIHSPFTHLCQEEEFSHIACWSNSANPYASSDELLQLTFYEINSPSCCKYLFVACSHYFLASVYCMHSVNL